jgi:antitoxin VapB
MIHGVNIATHGEIMALNIRNQQAEDLATALAALMGESKTEAVIKALQERLDRMRRTRRKRSLADELNEIAAHCGSLNVLDARSADEVLGYDATGLPR